MCGSGSSLVALQGSCAGGADAVVVVKQQQQQQFGELRVGNLEQEALGRAAVECDNKGRRDQFLLQNLWRERERARELALGVKRSIEDERIAVTHKSCTEE